MKKIIQLLTLCLILSNITYAQNKSSSGFYIGAHGGYNEKFGGTRGVSFINLVMGIPFLTVDQNDTYIETVSFSYGKGINAGLNFGYMFNDHFGVELGADYFMGSNNTFENKSGSSTATYKTKGQMIQLSPMVVASTGGDKISGYTKVGLIVGIAGKVIDDYYAVEPSGYESVVFERTGGLGLGFTVAGGAEFGINETLSLFSEINFKNLAYSPKKGEITKVDANGVDQLPSIDPVYKTINFVKDANMGGGTPTQPRDVPQVNQAFNSIGLTVGVKMRF